MQYYRIISLDNNNSVKFTSSREDNSTTNDSMVMKIAHAQLHMYTNIMNKFQSSTCKTVGEKLWTKLCPRTDRCMDRLRCGGYKHKEDTQIYLRQATTNWWNLTFVWQGGQGVELEVYGVSLEHLSLSLGLLHLL